MVILFGMDFQLKKTVGNKLKIIEKIYIISDDLQKVF